MLNTRMRKLIFGLFLLLLVDIIWVSSSELTKVNDFILLLFSPTNLIYQLIQFQYLYENEKFDKPFFCTYFKTSMFTFYLLVLGLISPWKDSCNKNANYTVDLKQNFCNIFLIR